MTSGISRRHLLTVAGLTLGTAWVEIGFPAMAAMAAPTAQLTVTPLPDQPVAVLSAAGTAPAALPRQLAVRINNDGLELPAGTQIKVAFDRRVYATLARPLVTLGGQGVASTGATAPDPATGATVCTLTLGEAVPAATASTGALIALVGTANAHAYPHDLITRPATATATVPATGMHAGARHELNPARPSGFGPAATPWGIEVSAGWNRLTWGAGGRYWYYYPVLMSATGTGPGRSPAAELTVAVDPRIVTDVTVVAARLNRRPHSISGISRGGGTVTGTIRQVRWRTGVRLGAGDQLDVQLRVTTAAPAGPLDTITHAVVGSGFGVETAARQTGQMSVSRTDSRWS